MKKLSISKQIVLMFSFLFLLFSTTMYVVLPFAINYAYVDGVNNELLKSATSSTFVNTFSEDYREIQKIFLTDNVDVVNFNSKFFLNRDILDVFLKSAREQEDLVELYEYSSDDYRVFYAIKKVNDNYYISYKFDGHMLSIIALTRNILLIISILFFMTGVIITVIFTNIIVGPLNKLIKSVNDMKTNGMNEEIKVTTTSEEIGLLANNIESLRKSLIEEQALQKEMFQNISHDLKTPIMVINSFALAIKDEIYPKGSLDGSLDVIIEETNRLENKVKSIIYISKLNYLKENIEMSEVNVTECIKDICDKLCVNNPELSVIYDTEEYYDNLEIGMFTVAIENIINNFLRYAKSKIVVTIKDGSITLYNDGDNIDEDLINDVFIPYKKGDKGEFGLGLSITLKSLNLFNYDIVARNEEEGVSFIITKNK